VIALGRWKYYRAKLNAYLVDGSYEFTQGDFKGQIMTPPIDRMGSEPGPGWERLHEPPDPKDNVILAVLYRGGVKEALLQNMSPRALAS